MNSEALTAEGSQEETGSAYTCGRATVNSQAFRWGELDLSNHSGIDADARIIAGEAECQFGPIL
jgi:hypothetical protein